MSPHLNLTHAEPSTTWVGWEPGGVGAWGGWEPGGVEPGGVEPGGWSLGGWSLGGGAGNGGGWGWGGCGEWGWGGGWVRLGRVEAGITMHCSFISMYSERADYCLSKNNCCSSKCRVCRYYNIIPLSGRC